MIRVIDAAAVVDLLLRSDPGERVRRLLAADPDEPLVTVAHLDAEVFSALARLCRAGELTVADVSTLLRRLSALDLQRVTITAALLDAAWSLRENVAARDALYVAAASALDGRLVTTDERLARSVPGFASDLPR